MDAKRRKVLDCLAAAVILPLSSAVAAQRETQELQIDHVMFPVYYNDSFIELVKNSWKTRTLGEIESATKNARFKAVYLKSKSFYVEYLSTVENEPYWSNAVYVVVPKRYWDFYKNPAVRNEFFLIPYFGCGYQLVSPEYAHLNKTFSRNLSYDGLTLLISRELEQALTNIGGLQWSLPGTGKIRVHEGLRHIHDMAVIDEQSKIVAPILQANPLLREFL